MHKRATDTQANVLRAVFATICVGLLIGLAERQVVHAQEMPIPDTLDWHGYMPLEVGNLWQYHRTQTVDGWGLVGEWYEEWRIAADTVLDARSYYVLTSQCTPIWKWEDVPLDVCQEEAPDTTFLRYDEEAAYLIDGRVWEGKVSWEPFWLDEQADSSLHIRLDAPFNSTDSSDGTVTQYHYRPAEFAIQEGIFAPGRAVKEVVRYGVPWMRFEFAHGVGLQHYSAGEGINHHLTLNAARVDGREYGLTCPHSPGDAFADTLDPSGYLPFQEGNVWEYESRYFSWLDNLRRISVQGDTLIDGRRFWKLEHTILTWPDGAVDPHQPGVVAHRNWSYQSMESGVLATWARGRGINEHVDFRQPINSCRGGDSWLTVRSGEYNTNVELTGADGVRRPVYVKAATLITVLLASAGDSYSSFAYGIGEIGSAVEGGESALRYARIDGVEYGSAFEGVFPTTSDPEEMRARRQIDLKVYPNPAAHTVRISVETTEPETASLEVIDVLGRRVAFLLDRAPANPPGLEAEWSAAASPAGIYFVRLTTGSGSVLVRRLVVVR